MSIGSEGNKNQDNENEDTGRNEGTREPNAYYEAEDNNNEISSIMDKNMERGPGKICGLGNENATHP